MDAQISVVRIEFGEQEEFVADTPSARDLERQLSDYFVEITGLNRVFLSLLQSHGREPLDALQALRAAPASAIHAMAACTFPLFVVDGVHGASDDNSPAGSDATLSGDAGSSVHSFAMSALFLAWHFAQSNSFAARAVLGLHPRQIERLRTLTLMQAQASMLAGTARVRPRWPDNRRFWALLTRDAENGESMRSVCRLGRQLIASDDLARIPALAKHARRSMSTPVRERVSLSGGMTLKK